MDCYRGCCSFLFLRYFEFFLRSVNRCWFFLFWVEVEEKFRVGVDRVFEMGDIVMFMDCRLGIGVKESSINS